MSDDRMDRAARIRNMREGNRGTDDKTDDGRDETESSSEPAASTSTDGDAAADDGTASEAATEHSATESADETGFSPLSTAGDESGSATGTTSTAEQASTNPPSGAAAADTASAAQQAADSVPSQTESTTDTDTASEAQAAAQRAAASAAEVMGGGAETDGVAQSGAPAGTETSTGDDTASGAPAGATGAGTVPGDVTGVELPDRELLEAAMATSSVESTEGGARAAMGEESTQSEEIVRVLEFSLGEEYYCLDIEYVEEIVKRDTVTRVPNTPGFVDGVVDLRGQITTILEPKEMMDIDSEGEQNLIIVFDPEQFEEQGAVGWVVDEVRQVVPVTESEINNPPVDAEYINGVVDREEHDQFVIWVEPGDALAQATATGDD